MTTSGTCAGLGGERKVRGPRVQCLVNTRAPAFIWNHRKQSTNTMTSCCSNARHQITPLLALLAPLANQYATFGHVGLHKFW